MLPARSSDESCGWAGAIGIWHGLGYFSEILDGCPKGDNSGDGSNPPGGGERLSYISYIEVCAAPHWVGFLRRFGLKTRIHFAHFRLE